MPDWLFYSIVIIQFILIIIIPIQLYNSFPKVENKVVWFLIATFGMISIIFIPREICNGISEINEKKGKIYDLEPVDNFREISKIQLKISELINRGRK